jgi:predicted RNA-binding Zn ribbon-like protein
MTRAEAPESARNAAAEANLVGGWPCLDFVNTIGARRPGRSGALLIRDEFLRSYVDFALWAEHAGVLGRRDARSLLEEARCHPREAKAVFGGVLRLREALYRIFKATLVGRSSERRDLALLNGELAAARGSQRLALGTGGRFVFSWPGASLRTPGWVIAVSAAELLTTADLSRLRQCGGDDCGWLFEDTTRNRSRHWCDTRDCGNRDRVRRFRRRHGSRGPRDRSRPRGDRDEGRGRGPASRR